LPARRPAGLILAVIAGSELLTGNMALVPLAALRGRATWRSLVAGFIWVLFGTLVGGSVFVAGIYSYL
jgi:formate/nitrite transporter FocA (FNT family)